MHAVVVNFVCMSLLGTEGKTLNGGFRMERAIMLIKWKKILPEKKKRKVVWVISCLNRKKKGHIGCPPSKNRFLG